MSGPRVLGAIFCAKCGTARHAKVAEIQRGADGHLLLVGRGALKDFGDIEGTWKEREWFVMLKGTDEPENRERVAAEHEVDLSVTDTAVVHCNRHGPEHITRGMVTDALHRPTARTKRVALTINR